MRMSNLAAIAIGGISALLLVPLIHFELRGGIVHNCRRLLGSSTVEVGGQDETGVWYATRSKGISIRVAAVAISVAALIVLFGVLSDRLFFVLLGSFAGSNVIFIFFASRVAAARFRQISDDSSR